MKNATENVKKLAEVSPGDCSEKNCGTCFEHRGCMYEQFLFIAIRNLVDPCPPAKITLADAAIGKRA